LGDSSDNEGDVYAMGDDVGDFVGAQNGGLMDISVTVDEMLQDGVGELESGLKPHMMSIVVADKPGVLNLVRAPHPTSFRTHVVSARGQA
jgi:hypothetical protein